MDGEGDSSPRQAGEVRVFTFRESGSVGGDSEGDVGDTGCPHKSFSTFHTSDQPIRGGCGGGGGGCEQNNGYGAIAWSIAPLMRNAWQDLLSNPPSHWSGSPSRNITSFREQWCHQPIIILEQSNRHYLKTLLTMYTRQLSDDIKRHSHTLSALHDFMHKTQRCL